MATKDAKVMNLETVERQRRYVDTQKSKGSGLGIVFADAFLRGMRDIGYKSPAWALSEQIDNSVQAAATTISIRQGFTTENKGKPDMLALCDNGNGMIPDMIGYAVRWGGTDREDDRTGFGRYGYGLPSSAVSLARRYTVYSKVPGDGWHSVTVDIGELGKAADDVNRTAELLAPKKSALPKWLVAAEDKMDLSAIDSGTVIVFEDLDRLRKLPGWKTAKTLREKLLKDLGIIYRFWLPERKIFVDGVQTQPVDPLFLMEHALHYDETEVRSQRVQARTFEVTTSRGTKGTVSIRASILPPNFQLANPDDYRRGSKTNKRFNIMRMENGLFITRERRQIDCITPRFTKFQNYDLNIRIEIDFDPELDEFFGMTTSKQQIVIDEEMWDLLESRGENGGALKDLVDDMRTAWRGLQTQLKAAAENQSTPEAKPKPSVVAMQRSAKFKAKPSEPTAEQKQESEKTVREEAKRRARVTGKSVEEEAEQVRKQTAEWPFALHFKALSEGPFYLAQRLGEQYVLVINTDHPFYTKLYEPTPAARGGLEILLFMLAERELESSGDRNTFYKSERHYWSERLRRAYDEYVDDQALNDEGSAADEEAEVAAQAG
jgi:hypothetical protein